MLLQIPFGGKALGANGTAVFFFHIAVSLHMRFDAG